jgi:hypothetical protein
VTGGDLDFGDLGFWTCFFVPLFLLDYGSWPTQPESYGPNMCTLCRVVQYVDLGSSITGTGIIGSMELLRGVLYFLDFELLLLVCCAEPFWIKFLCSLGLGQ